MKQQHFQFERWRTVVPVMAAMFASQAAAAQSPLPCRYEIAAVLEGPFCPQFGNAPVYARGLSNHDPPWVVGFYPECVIGPFKAFVWTGAGNVQPITFPGGNIETSFAYDVTDTGLVVGAFAQPGQPTRGFIYDVASGGWTQVNPVIPAGGCVIRAANNAGMVVGNRTISQTAYNAFIYHNGVYTDLGVMNGPNSEAWAISENGIVVGWTGPDQTNSNTRAFVYEDGKVTILPPIPNGTSSAGLAVNQYGEVAGRGLYLSQWGIVSRAFCTDEFGNLTRLDPLPGYRHSFAFGISDDSTVVGYSRVLANGSDSFRACLWRNGQVVELNQEVSAGQLANLQSAWSISNSGKILCEAIQNGEQVATVLSPIFSPLGDINVDCSVNVDDLWVLIADWGATTSPADLNQDQLVNVLDLLIVIENWTFN